MKKIIAIAAILMTAAMLTSCGTDETETTDFKAPTTASASTEPTSTAAETAETEAAATEATETTAAATEAQETADLSDLAGYWYVDGDPSSSWMHISADGTFAQYRPDGNKMYDGTIKYGEVDETGKMGYIFTNDFDTKTSFIRSDDFTLDPVTEYGEHFQRLYSEGGLSDDGRGDDEKSDAEEYIGTWGSERASITIEDYGEGVFHARITWSSSAASFAEWDYPLIFDGECLVCDGKGVKTYVEYQSPDTEPERTIVAENCSARFELRPDGLFWNDLTNHEGDIKIFIKAQPIG